MDLDEVIKTKDTIDFTILESANQECTKKILFSLLDKNESINQMKDYIQKCQVIVNAYRNRLQMNTKDLGDVKL